MPRRSSPKPRMPSCARTWSGPAPPPNARPPCSRTTHRCTCCWDVSISPPAGRAMPSRSCAVPCGSTRCSFPLTACSRTRWCRWDASPKRSSSGITGSGSRPTTSASWRTRKRCVRRRPPRSCSRGRVSAAREGHVSDDVKALSTQLATDPQSLVFLRLGELLRQKRQFDAASRVAQHGLERHPHLADAHDLLARIFADAHDYEHAFDEWDMTLRIAPQHTGALKGLAFLYFKNGDLVQAEAHLQAARDAAPDDPTIDQAFAVIRGEAGATLAAPPPPHPSPPSPAAVAPPEPADAQLPDERVFAGLEGAQEG